MSVLLRTEHLSKRYGGLRAVDDLSFTVEDGEVFGIVGPNGAGKTTLFDLLSGVVPRTSGQIFVRGHRATGLSAPRLCHLGVVRTFQTPVTFATQSVLRNALVGAMFGRPRHARRDDPFRLAQEALEFVGLQHQARALAGDLGVLDQKRLMLASALASQPSLLLLDEPMGGLTREEMLEASDLVRKIKAEGVTILVIEHVMEAVLALSNRVMVLHHGQAIFNGLPEELIRNSDVRRVYLGLNEEAPRHAQS